MRGLRALRRHCSKSPSVTSKEQRETAASQHKEQLYASVDDLGLSEAGGSPPIHEWVDNGTLLIRGSTYISAIKTSLGVTNTKLRSSRGRVNAPVLCDLGCGKIESLGHILQSRPKFAPETVRHDKVLSLLIQRLNSKHHQTLREPNIRTSAGLWIPDVVVWNLRQSVVLDVQIVFDSSAGESLDRAHSLKRFYYDVGEVRDWTTQRTGLTPVFFGAASWPPPSIWP